MIFYILDYTIPLLGNVSFSQWPQYFVYFSLLVVLDIPCLLFQICFPPFHFVLCPRKLISMTCINWISLLSAFQLFWPMEIASSVLVVNKKRQVKIFIRLDLSLPGCELTLFETSLRAKQPSPRAVKCYRVLILIFPLVLSHIEVVTVFCKNNGMLYHPLWVFFNPVNTFVNKQTNKKQIPIPILISLKLSPLNVPCVSFQRLNDNRIRLYFSLKFLLKDTFYKTLGADFIVPQFCISDSQVYGFLWIYQN